MDSFRWIAVTLSLILGFGVTRLLSAGVAMFRSRSHAQLDWIPLVWAGCIFFWQIQYWWAVIELPRLIQTWYLGQFMILLGLALLLFVTAALILPASELGENEKLSDAFERDNHWALACLSAYFAMAFFADWHFWGISPISYLGGLLGGLCLIPLMFIATSSRKAKGVLTVLYVILSLWSGWELSPKVY